MIKGFREEYDSYDLEAACIHGSHDEESLKFKAYEDLDPIDLLETMGLDLKPLLKHERGSGNSLTKVSLQKILHSINGGTRSHWQTLLEFHEGNQLPPVIVVQGELCDGAHRCILQYIFNEKVPAALFSY